MNQQVNINLGLSNYYQFTLENVYYKYAEKKAAWTMQYYKYTKELLVHFCNKESKRIVR